MTRSWLIVCNILMTGALCAQTAPQQAPAAARHTAATTFAGGGMPMFVAPITGAPFSGVRETEHRQTLADGTHIVQKQAYVKIYRDAEGRTRTEQAFVGGFNNAANVQEAPKIIRISDPVAGYAYTLDTQNRIAHRQAVQTHLPVMPPPPPPPPGNPTIGQGGGGGGGVVFFDPLTKARPATGNQRTGGVMGGILGAVPGDAPQIERESLGTKTIDGLMVNGNRITSTIPAGAQGNDRPIATVTETWSSPDLRETIESTSNDPRSGEYSTRLTSIDRNNPDPGLFLPPSDYQIVDDEGQFSVQLPAAPTQK